MRRLLLHDVVAARWAGVILLEPRQDAICVEVMLASQEENFVVSLVGLHADGADVFLFRFEFTLWAVEG